MVIFALQPELSTGALILRSFVVFVVAALVTTLVLALLRLRHQEPSEDAVAPEKAAKEG